MNAQSLKLTPTLLPFRLCGLVEMLLGLLENVLVLMECIGTIGRCNVVNDFWVELLVSQALLLQSCCYFVVVVEHSHFLEDSCETKRTLKLRNQSKIWNFNLRIIFMYLQHLQNWNKIFQYPPKFSFILALFMFIWFN